MRKKPIPRFFPKKFLVAAIFLILVLIIEATTDFVEIVIGTVLDVINPYRPQSGTMWELYTHDQAAAAQLEQIVRSLPTQKLEIADIADLMQLQTRLKQDTAIIITAAQFRSIYTQIPPQLAYEMIPPFDLLKLAHSHTWVWTKVVKHASNLSLYFLDGDKQLLMDTYPPLSVLYQISEAESITQTLMDSMMAFKGRIITRDQFFTVLNDLPNSVKLRLINNPFDLIKWYQNIQKVGISRYVKDNTVTIGFQVDRGIYSQVFTFEASDWAMEYFIDRFNQIYPKLTLDVPEGMITRFPNYE